VSSGRVVIICGPSGVGKSTVLDVLLRRHPELATVVSCTTRPPRPGDGTAKAYVHLSREEFERQRAAGAFLEWAEVHGELYGTPREPLKALLDVGRTVALEIDVQGARKIKEAVPDAVVIFLEPPSWEVLEARLRARGTEDEERLRVRLDTARKELSEAGEFDHRVVNEDLDRAVEEVDRILKRVMST
jgi:guanylate kinase